MQIPDSILKLKKQPLAVACSGGADSMALALLAAESDAQITVLTVDHGLRAESAAEAKQVQRWLAKRGINHVTLMWQGKKPTRNIQEFARKARYQLMADYCLAHGIKHLLVAHHSQDQAETFLLRLARGSGVDGLSAMQPVSELYGITILRPLLNVTKAELISYLRTQKQKYINDPSNDNSAYDRVRMRKALPMLTELGLTVERLAATAENMQRARSALEAETAKIFAEHCRLLPEGYATLARFTAADEITLRILASVVMTIGDHEVRPRLNDLERLQTSLFTSTFKGATLGGCQFIAGKNRMLICREPHAAAGPVPAGSKTWDRFTLQCAARKGWTIGALTQAGWLSVAKKYKITSHVPDKKILYSLPALRDESGTVVAVPHLGIEEKSVKFTARFKAAQR